MSYSERNEERNFILECIQVYRDHSAIWEIKSDNYMDRKIRKITRMMFY